MDFVSTGALPGIAQRSAKAPPVPAHNRSPVSTGPLEGLPVGYENSSCLWRIPTTRAGGKRLPLALWVRASVRKSAKQFIDATHPVFIDPNQYGLFTHQKNQQRRAV